MQSLKLYRRLMGYVFPYWKMVLLMFITTAAYASTNALVINTLKPIVDEGFIQQSSAAIHTAILSLFFIVIVRGISFFISNFSSRWVTSQVVLDIRKKMFAHLHLLPNSYFDRTNTGETLSKFNYDVLQVTSAATNAIIVLVREGVTVITLLAFLFFQNAALTSSILVIAPIVALIITKVSKKLRTISKKIQTDMGDMNHILDENIKGQKIIKVYHASSHEIEKFNRSAKRIKQSTVKSQAVSSLSTPIVEVIIMIVLAFVIISLAREAQKGTITAGEFVTYIGMMALLFSPIKKLTQINEYMQRGLAASESIFKFLDEAPEKNDSHPSQHIQNIEGSLSFNDVCFRYDEQSELVLDHLNLNIKAGDTVAIVGSSGSGKSSIASLIPRFYDVCSGSIKMDNFDISKLDLQFLRQQISFVNQEIVLFDDTVTRNIAYGVKAEEINIDRVKEAAKNAFATDFIENMEHGFESRIGESGQKLSGGQKQRLAIARAMYKNAPIFILDEATSALDSESEEKVQIALDKLIANKTSIIIAHRLSTVRNADYIVVLEKGRIIETGTHKELLQQEGYYYKLHHLGNFTN